MTWIDVTVVKISCSALVKLKCHVHFLFMTKDQAINMLINANNLPKAKYLWSSKQLLCLTQKWMTKNQEQKTIFKSKWLRRKRNRSKQNTKMEWCKRRKNDLLKIIENIFRKAGSSYIIILEKENFVNLLSWYVKNLRHTCDYFDKFQSFW